MNRPPRRPRHPAPSIPSSSCPLPRSARGPGPARARIYQRAVPVAEPVTALPGQQPRGDEEQQSERVGGRHRGGGRGQRARSHRAVEAHESQLGAATTVRPGGTGVRPGWSRCTSTHRTPSRRSAPAGSGPASAASARAARRPSPGHAHVAHHEVVVHDHRPREVAARRVEDGAVAVPVESPERAPGQHHGVPAAGRHGLAHPRPLGWVVRRPRAGRTRPTRGRGAGPPGRRRPWPGRGPRSSRSAHGAGHPGHARAGSDREQQRPGGQPLLPVAQQARGRDCLHEPGQQVAGPRGRSGEREPEARGRRGREPQRRPAAGTTGAGEGRRAPRPRAGPPWRLRRVRSPATPGRRRRSTPRRARRPRPPGPAPPRRARRRRPPRCPGPPRRLRRGGGRGATRARRARPRRSRRPTTPASARPGRMPPTRPPSSPPVGVSAHSPSRTTSRASDLPSPPRAPCAAVTSHGRAA